MAGTNPVVSDGMLEVRALTSWTGPAMTVAAYSAGTDVTCDLLGDGLSRDTTENAVTIDRLCSKQVGESPGSVQESLELTYAWDPQGSGSTSAYAKLTPGSKVFFAIRYGIAHGTAAAAAQKVDVIEGICGEQRRVAVARNEEMRVTQKIFVAPGGVFNDVALTAP